MPWFLLGGIPFSGQMRCSAFNCVNRVIVKPNLRKIKKTFKIKVFLQFFGSPGERRREVYCCASAVLRVRQGQLLRSQSF